MDIILVYLTDPEMPSSHTQVRIIKSRLEVTYICMCAGRLHGKLFITYFFWCITS